MSSQENIDISPYVYLLHVFIGELGLYHYYFEIIIINLMTNHASIEFNI